ncbi:MAG: hypothetical protein MUF38_01490 [Anaerolineae bacterium]|jgi:hypothetical protein|nr:hypothetical protein [Anaerolineae bacterium]
MQARNKSTLIYLGIGLLLTVGAWVFDPTLRPQIPPDQIIPAFLMALGFYTLAFFIMRAWTDYGYGRDGDALEFMIKAWRSEDKIQRYMARGFVMFNLILLGLMVILPPSVVISASMAMMLLLTGGLVLATIVAAFYVALKARPTE